MSQATTFLQDAEQKAFDQGHRDRLNFNIDKYRETVDKGMTQYRDLESAKRKAKNLRWRAIEQLDAMLLEFEKNFTRNGGKVIWANDTAEALREIDKVLQKHHTKTVVKSKSMATEELELNEHLEKANIEVFETDLGEYIVQLAGEKPYHIVTPAMHKSKEDVAQLFHEKLGTPLDLTPTALAKVAREKLREKYQAAEVGFTGGNFLVADSGSIAITENEGNARLSSSLPKVHIAVVGIEKMIPNLSDLALLWPLLATHGTGQQVTVYNTILSGPKRDNESDGPEEMYVVLLDNGRTNILANTVQRESLFCIRCGACLNACPVYKNIGGHSYGTTYSGPIGSVITPNLKGMEAFNHLSYASSLCGNCTEVCPVNINLHELLLDNRKVSVAEKFTTKRERLAWTLWQRGMLNRSLMNLGNAGIKRWAMQRLFGKTWGKRKSLPEFPKKSFQQLWKEKQSS